MIVRALLVVACVALTACHDGSDPVPADTVTFEFRTRGYGPEEAFHARTSDPDVIAQVRAQLALPEEERMLFPIGDIARGDGGHNEPWDWHYTEFVLTEMSIELCDGTPSMVDADIDYWVDTVGNYCPWGGYAWAEVTAE